MCPQTWTWTTYCRASSVMLTWLPTWTRSWTRLGLTPPSSSVREPVLTWWPMTWPTLSVLSCAAREYSAYIDSCPIKTPGFLVTINKLSQLLHSWWPKSPWYVTYFTWSVLIKIKRVPTFSIVDRVFVVSAKGCVFIQKFCISCSRLVPICLFQFPESGSEVSPWEPAGWPSQEIHSGQ